MKLTKNFSIVEFDCRDGTKVPYELVPNVTRVADNLQVLRDHINSPIHINSAYRTESHNRAVGGASTSQHLLAKAADITSRDFTPKELYDIIEQLISEGKMKEGGIGLYKGFVHYDIRDKRARW